MEHLTTFRRPWRCRTLLALIAVLSGGGCYVESESPLDRRDGTDTDEATESSASGVDETGSVDAANEDSGIDGSDSTDSTAGGSSGPAPECTLDAECDDDNPCTVDVCEAAECTRLAIDGLRAPQQSSGDCRVVLCVAGVVEEVVDLEDLPEDDNDCTLDACEGDTAVHQPLPAGAPCSGGIVCDGFGACDECASPANCDALPLDDDCQVRTCDDGTCGQAFAPLGAAVNATFQTAGDCQRVVCDGNGGTTGQPDGTDPTIDGLECTTDVCDAGVPDNVPLSNGSPCAAGECNSSGGCVGCNDADDCGDAEFCQAPSCSVQGVCGVVDTDEGTPLPGGQQQDEDCQELRCDGAGAAASYVDDGDLPDPDGNDCTRDLCIGGLEQHPDESYGTPCNGGGGTFCNGAGACVECTVATDCAAADQCDVAVCTAGACGVEPGPAGTPCTDGLFCTQTDTCDGSSACVGVGSPCDGADGDGDCSESCDEQGETCDGDDAEGSGCDDAIYCTTEDACSAGVCGGAPVTCADEDESCREDCQGCCED